MFLRLALLTGIVIVSGCSSAGPSDSSGPTEAAPASPGVPTADPDPAMSEPAPASEAPLPEPPGGILTAGAGPDGSTEGTLGSWTLDGFASDAPWLPTGSVAEATLQVGTRTTVGFGDRTPIGAWSASLATIEDVTGESRRGVGSGEAAGSPSITLAPLPAGSWVLAVTLRRADDRGDATYYWAIEVR